MNRSIKELLEIMLNNQKYFTYGLCQWIQKLSQIGIITFAEREILQDFIKNNKPSIFSSWSVLFNLKCGYFWKYGKIKPRIKWIKKHIKKLS